MLEAVVNLSEGRSESLLAEIGSAAGSSLLDCHSDAWHHRSVLTLAGEEVLDAVKAVARIALDLIDYTRHEGAHPRLGAIDVVPFVPLSLDGGGTTLEAALAARDSFATWAGEELGLPCFLYGPERTLPEVRRGAWSDLLPDTGPPKPHPTGGACCVGARRVLVAYNLWLSQKDLNEARAIAQSLRSPTVRALAFDLDGRIQVSCNLVEPEVTGPLAVYQAVAQRAQIDQAELVGLLPERVLEQTPPARWDELDLAEERTIEFRLRRAGLLGRQA